MLDIGYSYDFRSRLVEVMALGVPVVASPDAVHGMGLIEGEGILLGSSVSDLAESVLHLLSHAEYSSNQSRLARQQAEYSFSLEKTYGKLAEEMWGQVQKQTVKL